MRCNSTQNNSGSLDSGELDAVAKQLGKDLTPAELTQMMKELDTDGNGEVSIAEFSKFWKAKFTGTLVAGSKLAAMMAQFADQKHIDGVAYHPDRYVDPEDEMRARCWMLFEEIDGNHDNHISYMEFIKWWKSKDKEENHGKSTLSDEVLRQSQEKFTAFDSNGNGTIDRDELAGLIRALDLEKYVPTTAELEDDDPPMYVVYIHTGGHPEAGTDATVHITLFGEDGDTGRRNLTSTKASDSFNRGQINTFKLRSVDVGAIQRIHIGHDNKSTDALAKNAMDATGAKAKYLHDEACKWQLDKVVVKKKGGEPVAFGCAEWFDLNSGDKQIERDLYPGERTFQDDDVVTNPMALAGDDDEKAPPKPVDTKRKLIIESASGLNNADTFFGGKSDPYAIISWNGKVLGKTKTLDNTLHPIWNEEFEFDVAEEGLLRIEVYDHDVFFKDDLLGKVEMKLGGKTNSHGMLSRNDYTFQEPEVFAGHVTLRVEHASHRLSTEEQLLFRDRFMKGETMRSRREKHVFESNTRLIVMAITACMAVFGSFMCGYSLWLLNLCQTSPYVAYAYLIISPIIALSSAFGFYGAWRVKADTEAAKGTTEGNIAHGSDDDGLQTTGQVILEVYFHASLICIICWLWLIIETFAVGTAGSDAGCHTDHDGGVINLAYGGLVAVLAVIFCMYNVVKIVSFFEILQSLAEGINMCLLLLGFGVMILGSLIVKQTLCLAPPDELSSQKGNASLGISMVVFGVLIVSTAFFGFVSAVHESMSHLLQHAILQGVLMFFGLILTAVLFLRGVDSLVDDNCEGMLSTLPATFFEEYASCSKYKGYTELWNGTGWQLGSGISFTDLSSGEPFVADLGDMAICNPKELASFAWEVNPYTRPDGSTVNLYGCVNANPVDGCCEAIKDKMHRFDYGIAALFVLLFAMMAAAIYASLYLRYETTIIGHILIHPYAKRIFIVMKVLILIACIGMPFLLTGSNCGGIKVADLNAQKNLLPKGAAQSSAEFYAPSCFNDILDGMETDIDCGGECSRLCGVRKGCEDETDCALGLFCAAQANLPLSTECWDNRCIPGQAMGCAEGNCRLQGFCAHPTALQLCGDGEMNYRETDLDCGGPDCRGLEAPQLCDLDQRCRAASDCKGTCTGTDGNGNDCANTAAFMAPDGSGAAVDCPTADGCVFTPRQCIGGLCKSICNQALQGLIDNAVNTCGGVCEPCSGDPGQSCAVDSDCVTNRCYRPTQDQPGECVSYYNSRQDGSETAVDCGGDAAANFPCELGAPCLIDADCATGNCGGTCSGTVTTTQEDCATVTDFVLRGTEDSCPTTDGCTYEENKCAVVTAATQCNDLAMNFMETDEDCGGMSCVTVGNTCDTGKTCSTNEDCTAGACSPPPDSRCFGCNDGIQNGDETAADCGGLTCNRKCADAQACERNSDCQSDRCFGPAGAKTCVSYFNRLKDGDETDVDCGGSAAERQGLRCAVGQRCSGNVDCSTSVCGTGSDEECVARDLNNAAAVAACGAVTDILLNSTACESTTVSDGAGGTLRAVCAWSSKCRTRTPLEVCTDGQQAFPETDVDCGGEACRSVGRSCADGMRCQVDGDCAASSACHADTRRCVSCSNGLQDGDETDIDCGGVCDSCAWGQGCSQDDDCASNMCNPATSSTSASGVCTSCNNGIVDGTETDVDCGGDCDKGCNIGLGCRTTDDCAAGVCDSSTGPLLCRALSAQELCNNGIQDREETDVDCGGSECATLPQGCLAQTATNPAGRCQANRDCEASAYCFLGWCSSCTNNIKDGDESDIDCGGSNGCARCVHRSQGGRLAQFCTRNADCVSNLCYRVGGGPIGQCVSYQNGVQDGDETCVDGGGMVQGTCPIGGGCYSDQDCSTNKCQTRACPDCSAGFVAGDADTCNPQCVLSADEMTCTCTQWQCRTLTPSESCDNGELDGAETDVDCGGAACATVSKQCAAATSTTRAQSCIEDRDCNGRCDANICVSCSNAALDGDETDVDCGGSFCGACSAATTTTAAQQCRSDSDCDTRSCYVTTAGQAGVCVSDSNGVQDGDETDVDCGGSTENTCEVGASCVSDSDCETKCQTDPCPDSCGVGGNFSPGSCNLASCIRGVTPGTCDLACTLSGTDASETCTCTPNVCRALTAQESCNNGEQDGQETDVDCGGEVCSAIGKRCLAPTIDSSVSQECLLDRDCMVPQSGDQPSHPARCLIRAGDEKGMCTSCSNGIMDGDESDVDCGGSCASCRSARPVCSGTGTDGSNCEQAVDFLASGDPSDCPAGCEFSITDAKRCVLNSDCISSRCYGIGAGPFVCVDSSNRVRDGDETCIDGGGAGADASFDGPLCDVGEGCEVHADCSTNKCAADSTCEAITAEESCNDGVQGPDESDIDCGGPTCATVDQQCGVGLKCYAATDCGPSTSPDDRCFDMTMATPLPCGPDSSFLLDSCTCVSCRDSEMNGDETDVDCGGGCRSCPVGDACLQDSDCDTNNCVNNLCEPTTNQLCVNGAHDPSPADANPAGALETDDDCGGPFCSQCADGKACLIARDCSSHVCTDMGDGSSQCTSCGNGVRDGLETDADCGSVACPNIPCRIDQWCREDADCGSGNCDTSGAVDAEAAQECVMSIGCGKCMAPLPSTTCNDGVLGETETCVDGGGAACRGIGNLCPTCGGAIGGSRCSCSVNSDCIDSHCSPSSGNCFSCSNNILDPLSEETDVDCGGPCSSCAVGQQCLIDADCSSGSCTDWGTGLAAADGMRCSSCTNGLRDGLETDVDCGADACGNTCSIGFGCSTGADCTSGNCDGGVCAQPTPAQTCNDDVMGEHETCTDGGGDQCTARPLRKRCNSCDADPASPGTVFQDAATCGCEQRRDCSSRKCFNGFCFSCANGLKDGSESGTDCGGDCAACPAGETCTSSWDCASRSCVDWNSDPAIDDFRCTDCNNGSKEDNEADVDCGADAGEGCQLCNIGQTCSRNEDCNSLTCDSATGQCVNLSPASTCNNEAMDGYETCIDGGGDECVGIGKTCPSCEPTCTGTLPDGTLCASLAECAAGCERGVAQTQSCSCLTDADCAFKCSSSGYCSSCTNGVRDGDETDVDCGGPCGRCEVGSRCNVADDCSSGVCSDSDCEGGVCNGVDDFRCTSCTNGLQDGVETDVDCGFLACPDALCGLNQQCLSNDDCASSNCDGGTCQAPTPDQTCNDGEIGQQETCVDGGGAQCRSVGNLCMTCAEAPGADNCGCAEDGDCRGDAYCDAAGIGGTVGCFSCSNNQQDGPETDVDCGGGRCNACAADKMCNVDSDCRSHQCTDIDTTGTAPNLRCTSCSNGLRDGLETDVDCGVTACSQPCQQGQRCEDSQDCATGSCGEQCQAVVSGVDADVQACSNVVMNTATSEAECNDVKTAADQTVTACVYTAPGTCAPPPLPDVTCNNGVQGQLETDVDCGGVACGMLGRQCRAVSADGDAQACVVGPDCASSLCVTGLCASCANSYVDGFESDQDCGGPDCVACRPASASPSQEAQRCSFGSDCNSGLCHVPCDPGDSSACPGTATCSRFGDVYVCTADSEWTPSPTGERPAMTNMGTCVAFTNGVRDGLETDIDCGGNAPLSCSIGDSCQRDEDCASGNCDSGTCATPDPSVSCYDGAQGELETDVDCGGAACRGLGRVCQTGQQCEANTDCETSACGTQSGLCSDCNNNIRDGDETAVDCGGGICGLCAAGQTCSDDTDCQSGLCSDAWQLPDGAKTCIQPGEIVFGSAGSIDMAGGSTINRALWMEQRDAPVHPLYDSQTAPCRLEVRVTSANGTQIQFEEPSNACTGANAVAPVVSRDELDSVVTLSGSLACISELLAAFSLETSCITPWGVEGDHTTGADDLTWAQVSADITDQSQCALFVPSGEVSTTLSVRIVGRMQIQVVGYVLPARCKSSISYSDSVLCKDAAISEARITAAVHPCQGAEDTCRDDISEYYSRVSCSQIVQFGMLECSGDAGALNPDIAGRLLSEFCRQTCDTCPKNGMIESLSGAVQASHPGFGGPLQQGAFEATLAFSHSDAQRGSSALVTIAKANYATVSLTVQLKNGVVDVGNIYLPEEPPKAQANVEGVCLDYFAASVEERGTTSTTFERGIGWGGATPVAAPDAQEQSLYADHCTSGPCENPSDGAFTYTQTNNQMGAKTLTCSLGNSTSTQFVTSNGAAYETKAQPMLISNPEDGFVAVLNWVDANQPSSFDDIADIEFYSEFGVDTDGDGTDDGAGCRLDSTVTPECGGARHLQDGPFYLPGTAPELAVLAEAISLDQLYRTVYTFYAYNRGAIQQDISCTSSSDECTQIIDMAVELFGPSGKVLDVRPYSQSLAMPYTRLFCIDGRQSPPVVMPAVATSSVGAPPRCTECPC